MPRSPAPISSFGAELQATLRKGAQQVVKITFPDRNMAIRFKHRVNALRAAMKRENHPDWKNLYRAGITDDPRDPKTVVIGPKDAEFRSFLRDAGVEAEEPLPTTSVTISDAPPGSVDSFLGDLHDITNVQKTLEEDTDAPSVPNLKDL